jgi:DNA-binding Lrp family transcriptional regulator
MMQQLKKKRIILNYNTIVDPIKFGFTNILVGINYRIFDSKTKNEIINELKQIDSIISIQEATQGVDLLVEYSILNLSAFNKLHTDVMHKFYKNIETKFIFPVVVKHKFERAYLANKKKNQKDDVICGDRETRKLTEKEMQVLELLIQEPQITFSKISNKTKMAAKTIVNIKKRLETRKIIRGYSCTLNYKKTNIHRQVIFLTVSGRGMGEINKLVEYSKTHKNIIELVKVIGEYQLFIIVESKAEINIINDLRSEFPIKNYLIVNVNNMPKEQYVPENLK